MGLHVPTSKLTLSASFLRSKSVDTSFVPVGKEVGERQNGRDTHTGGPNQNQTHTRTRRCRHAAATGKHRLLVLLLS